MHTSKVKVDAFLHISLRIHIQQGEHCCLIIYIYKVVLLIKIVNFIFMIAGHLFLFSPQHHEVTADC